MSDSESSSWNSESSSSEFEWDDLDRVYDVQAYPLSALLDGVKYEDLERCRRSIADGADANYSEIDHSYCPEGEIATPLIHKAVLWKNRELIQLLVENGANINKRDAPDDVHVLQYCVYVKSFSLFNLEEPSQFQERLDFMKFLFSLGCKPQGNILGLAIFSQRKSGHNEKFIFHGGNYDVCKLLIEHGCSMNDEGDGFVKSPIHEAGLSCDPNLVKLLVRYGVNLDIKEKIVHLHGKINPLESLICDFLDGNYHPEGQDWHPADCIHNAIEVIQIMLQGGSKVEESTINFCNQKMLEETGRNYPRKNYLIYLNGVLGALTLPLSLQSLCRSVIRRRVVADRVNRLCELELPKALKNFLDFGG